MPTTPAFKRLTIEQFAALLDRFPFTRQVNAVHMHHTWRPRRRDFRGHETIVSMWRFHTREQGWSDIAQHVTVDPEGGIWLGRNWNRPPASAAGHNGNSSFGPFMFEMIGDFDAGEDPFDGAQRDAAVQLVALVQERFGLAPGTLVFHNAMSAKSCPGSALDRDEILAEVARRREALARRGAGVRRGTPGEPSADEADERVVREAIEALGRIAGQPADPADAEPGHDAHEAGASVGALVEAASVRDATLRDAGLGAAALAALRPHLVNLEAGRFSDEGEASTTPADVDAIFEEHLPEALARARAAGRPLRLLFYAHGGLVSESRGLRIAARHVDWWKANDVYPVYFVWETGLFESVGQLLRRAGGGAARALGRDIHDYTTDPLIERTVRALQGRRIWDSMKWSAERAVDEPAAGRPDETGGGARYVAQRLARFCEAHQDAVELHAVGHSAGSIFHCHFLPVARRLGAPAFASVHFLAPAVRVDTFARLLAPVLADGSAARHLTLYTMKRDFERADQCAGVYRKSLLYLIHHALEDRRRTPILGLEESLRADRTMKALFGLGGAPSDRGEVVWSPTDADSGRSASRSLTHGGFDDDAPTLDSIVRRVLGKADADPVVGYTEPPAPAASARGWSEEAGWPEELQPLPPAGGAAAPSGWSAAGGTGSAGAGGAAGAPAPAPAGPPPCPSSVGAATRPAAGSRRALCVGIDRYPDPKDRLAGCAADARAWSDALSRLGFATTLLLDEQATREAIDRELLALVDGSAAGDVIVFQYAGHGTYVRDLDGDDEDSRDEALCPVDYATGALYIDDDVSRAFARIPAGVNMTCFMDCCHSGTNSRFAVGAPDGGFGSAGRNERKRYILPTPELEAAHAQFRQALGASRTRGSGGTSLMRDVKFAACLDSEVAWESDGHGEFTLRATRLLEGGIDGLTNAGFVERVGADFGHAARQHPMLDCSPEAKSWPLLQPLHGAGAAAPAPAPAPDGVDPALLASTLASIQTLLAQLGGR